MKVEIWSDVMCPFCYIGKRKFEKALEQFPNKDSVEVVWKSFQLDPTTVTDPNLNTIDHLAEKKGWGKSQANETIKHVTGIAKQVGLDFHFEKAVVANSFDAHRLSHLAKQQGKQNELEEKLFSAYFTEGKNTADHATLLQIGIDAELDKTDIEAVLKGEAYSLEVKKDIDEAQMIGISGVPFFVLDRKYAISGAQDTDTFLNALSKAYEEHQKENPLKLMNSLNDSSCGPEGCEV